MVGARSPTRWDEASRCRRFRMCLAMGSSKKLPPAEAGGRGLAFRQGVGGRGETGTPANGEKFAGVVWSLLSLRSFRTNHDRPGGSGASLDDLNMPVSKAACCSVRDRRRGVIACAFAARGPCRVAVARRRAYGRWRRHGNAGRRMTTGVGCCWRLCVCGYQLRRGPVSMWKRPPP